MGTQPRNEDAAPRDTRKAAQNSVSSHYTATTPPHDCIARLLDGMAAAGMPYTGKDSLKTDGTPNRWDEKGRRNGPLWCFVHELSSGHIAAAFGDWRTASSHHFKSWENGHAVDPNEAQRLLDELERRRKLAEDRESKSKGQAAKRAQEQWAYLPETGSSAYLERKQVQAFGIRYGADYHGNFIAVPMLDISGTLRAFQRIYEDGAKRFPKGSEKKGCYHLIGELDPIGELYLAEGYATAASIHQAAGKPVAVCFDAGNIRAVADALKAVYPDLRLILAADNDQWKASETGSDGKPKGNTGIKAAYAVAHAHPGTRVAIPSFENLDTSDKPTDFNDLARLAGLEHVARQLEEAFVPKEKGNGHDTAPPNLEAPPDFEYPPPECYEGDHQADPDNWPRLEPDDKPPHICTDQANGYLIAERSGRDLLYVIRIGWHAWSGTHWRMGEEFAYRKAQRLSRLILAEAARVTKKAADTEEASKRMEMTQIGEALTGWAAKSESRDRVYAAMAMAKPMLAIEHGELDNNHWLLNCVNGTLNLRTGTLRPHRRGDFITRCIPVAYDPEATCPTWLKFLDRTFASATEVIRFTQKAIGYSLTGDISEQCVFFCWGTGQNGKSTLLTVVQALMGAYAQQAAPDLLVVSKHEHHTTEIAELRGARLVASIETGEGRRLNEPLLKQMSGGDRMKGRFMRQDNIEFTPTHKTWLATNHKPKIRGTDYAIWRRIRLIPFVVTIPPEERDQKFPEKLKAELPGILAWAVQGCLAWQQEGLEPPKEVVEATDQYRADSDVLAAFLADRCIIQDGARVKAAELYNAYRQWCEQNGERLTETQTSFGLRMNERGFEKRKAAAGFVYIGIGLQVDGYEEGEL